MAAVTLCLCRRPVPADNPAGLPEAGLERRRLCQHGQRQPERRRRLAARAAPAPAAAAAPRPQSRQTGGHEGYVTAVGISGGYLLQLLANGPIFVFFTVNELTSFLVLAGRQL